MALDWVQAALQKCLGFKPYPATLNLRPKAQEDACAWEMIQEEINGVDIAPFDERFCSAKLFLVEIAAPPGESITQGAVLLPKVSGYPKDKIEVIAGMCLKDEFGVQDGDQLTLEFVH